MQQTMTIKPRALHCRPVRCQAVAKERRSPAQGVLALGAAVILAAAPVAHPDAAQAASYQERMEALQKRKDILAEARQQAEGGPSAANEPPAPKAPEAPSTGSSYLDKIQGSLSIQMQPGASGGAPEPEPEAPRSLFGGDKKGPMAFPSSPPEEKAAAVEESKPAFSFFSKFGGGGGGDSKPSEPESKPSSPFPAVDEPKGESKPAFSFGAAKKEEAPALPSFAAPFAAPPAPAPEAPSKPWWERTEELGGGTPAKKETKAEEPKKVEAKVDKKAEKKRAEEAEKAEKEAAAKKAAAAKEAAKKGGKRKTNGFALFGSQMLMLGGVVGGAYALLFKGEQLEGFMEAADKAILEATAKKEGTPSA